MSDIKLVLPDDNKLSPDEYVRTRLIPLTGELDRLCQEFFRPGSTVEAGDVDMAPREAAKYFTNVDERLQANKPKGCRFGYRPDIPLFDGEKKLRILLTAVLYVKPTGSAAFRLVRSRDGMEVEGSMIQVGCTEPMIFNRYIPYGHQSGHIDYMEDEYHIQARYIGSKCMPIVRRFTLSTVYV